MEYQVAKERVEECLTRMREDIQAYAESENASQFVVNKKLQELNTLIDFFNAATERVQELEWELLNQQTAYIALQHDTQKLVTFTSLHRINPNLIFHYTDDELKRMAAIGARIVPPRFSFDDIKFIQEGNTLHTVAPDEPYTYEQTANSMTNKYLHLTQFAR
jgi:hypothetical protein